MYRISVALSLMAFVACASAVCRIDNSKWSSAPQIALKNSIADDVVFLQDNKLQMVIQPAQKKLITVAAQGSTTYFLRGFSSSDYHKINGEFSKYINLQQVLTFKDTIIGVRITYSGSNSIVNIYYLNAYSSDPEEAFTFNAGANVKVHKALVTSSGQLCILYSEESDQKTNLWLAYHIEDDNTVFNKISQKFDSSSSSNTDCAQIKEKTILCHFQTKNGQQKSITGVFYSIQANQFSTKSYVKDATKITRVQTIATSTDYGFIYQTTDGSVVYTNSMLSTISLATHLFSSNNIKIVGWTAKSNGDLGVFFSSESTGTGKGSMGYQIVAQGKIAISVLLTQECNVNSLSVSPNGEVYGFVNDGVNGYIGKI